MGASSRIRARLEDASWIRRMFEEGHRLRAEMGADAVVDLSLGNPEIEPPPAVREALAALVAEARPGAHRYMPNVGLLEAREAVARRVGAECGLDVSPGDVVLVTGAAAGLSVLLCSVLEPDDEVVILAPYFPEYPFYIDHHRGRAVVAATGPGFHLDPGAVARVLTPRTRVVIVNSPNNPSGATYGRDELEALGAVLRERAPQALLVSDEPYKRIVYDEPFAPVLPASDRAVVVGSHSKDLALPGERIGWVVLSPKLPAEERAELVRAMAFVNRTLGFVNAPALMQRLIARLPDDVGVDPGLYRARRDLLVEGLSQAGYEVSAPAGAFYLFLPVPGGDDVAFVQALARRGVLAVPGRGFGVPGYARLSYCVDPSRIEQALPVLAEVRAALA